MAGPYTVGTTTTLNAFDFPLQRKMFYGASRYWVFWYTGGNMVFSSSTDGETWESSTSVRAVTQWSIWFDGTYVHYAVFLDSTDDLYYRRGTPNADGTITWTGEQTVHNGVTNDRYMNPVISVDSLDHAWIGVRYTKTTSADFYAEVFKNDNTDGTWSTAAGFPYRLISTNMAGRYVIPVPLSSDGEVACVHSRVYGAVDDLYLRLYDGASWDANVSVTSDINGAWIFGAVADGDDVHIVWLTNAPYDIKYRKWDYDTGLGVTQTVQSSVGSATRPVLSIDWAGTLYCFWEVGDIVYYKKCINGTWDTDPTTFLTESGIDQHMSAFYECYDTGIIPLGFVNGSLDIRFAWISSSSGTKIGDWLIDDDDACERILAFEIGSAADFAKKEIIGKDTPTVESTYTISPRAYKITARVGTTKRNNLQTTKDNHETIVLDSPFASINDLVKFEEFEYYWDGDECYSCPWLVIMTFVSTAV